MAKTTVEISGRAKNAYFESVFEAAGSDADAALATIKKEVRRLGVVKSADPRGRKKAGSTPAAAEPRLQDVPPEEPQPTTPKPCFNPYAIHTINVYKSDGREGLIAALGDVESLDNLKAMVKAQRVPVGEAFDTSDDLVSARAMVADAVAKRVSDRKAAAT
ncbi:MAG: hypothetical protein AAFZ01_04880 [Pseudomonadota bacterium]